MFTDNLFNMLKHSSTSTLITIYNFLLEELMKRGARV